MKKIHLLAMVAIVVVIVAAGGIAYITEMSNPIEVECINLSWGEVTPDTTIIYADIWVNNRFPFGLGSEAININVPIYFYDVQAAQFDLYEISLCKGYSPVDVTATMIQANLPQWWPDFIYHGELLAICIYPYVSTHIFGIPISTESHVQIEVPIPLLSEINNKEPKTMSIDVASLHKIAQNNIVPDMVHYKKNYFDDSLLLEIIQSPSEHFMEDFSPPLQGAQPILTMESWNLYWGDVTTETTQILGTIVLRNELSVPMPIQGLRLGLDMNEIPVVPNINIIPTEPILLPGESIPLTIDVDVNNDKLVQWWTSHLQQNEETIINVKIGVNVILPKELGFGFSEPIPLPLMPIPFFEHEIRTDIMGTINNQIIQTL